MKNKVNREFHAQVALRSLLLVVALAVLMGHAPLVFAQSPVAITDSSTPVALTTNNTGSSSTYVLNSDSSVSVLQNGALVAGAGCGPILPGDTVSNAAIYFDPTSNNLYAVMEAEGSSGASTMATYVNISNGTCTNGAAVTVSSIGFATNELGVDPVQGNVYVLQATQGGSIDSLYILSIPDLISQYYVPPIPNPTPPPALLNPVPQVSLDYSATYGPIVIDSSTHRVYINDLGDVESKFAGLIVSPGFFVYDPNNSATPSSNIQHVYGYINSSGTKVPLNAQTLLTNSGDLIVVNQNTSIANSGTPTFQTSPFTILHTTASGFSFFTSTQAGPSGPSPSVYIEPGSSGITVIGPGDSGASILDYSATGAADIDTVHGVIYRFAYNATGTNASSISLVTDSGALISFNLSTQADTLIPATGLQFANIYPSPALAPWSQMTFDPASNNVMLAAAGALGVSNSLACSDVTVQQVLGGGSTFSTLGNAAVNFLTAYIYDTDTVSLATTLYYVAPPATCASATLSLSPSVLPSGTAGQSYSAQFSVTSGSTGTVTFSSPSTPPTPAGLNVSTSGLLSGTPTQVGTFEVTVTATDSVGDTGSETLPLTIGCQTITVGPSPLPGAVLGVPYNITFTQTGGIGNVTYQAIGPFPPGISPTANGLVGTPTSTGSFPIGIQATDSNGCQSQNLIQTLTVSAPKFLMGPASPGGSPQCPAAGPGFPIGTVPTVTINGVSYFQVNVNLINIGNVSVSANLTSAVLGGFQAVNAGDPSISIFPVIFNNPGTLLTPGGCVSLTFYYPTVDFTSVSLPLAGYTEANVPQRLKMQGTFTAANVATPYSGNWSLTDPQVDLSSNLCCEAGGVGVGATGGNGYTGPISVGGNP